MKKRGPRSTKLNKDQLEMLEVLFGELGKIELIAEVLGVSPTSVSRWRRRKGVDHSVYDDVANLLTPAGVEVILGRKPLNLHMPPRQSARAPRSTSAHPHRRNALTRMIEQHGTLAAAARVLNKSVRSIARWLDGGGVDHSISSAIWNTLDGGIPKTPVAPPLSPMEEINNLFETGRKLHFEECRPIDACNVLAKVVFHPHLDSIPVVLMLDLISVIMS